MGASLHGHGHRSVTKIPEAIAPTYNFSKHSLWLVPHSPSPYYTAPNNT